MRERGQIENFDDVPEEFKYKEARILFKQPAIKKRAKIVFKEVDEDGLLDYMVNQKGFSEKKIMSGINKLKFKNYEEVSSAHEEHSSEIN